MNLRKFLSKYWEIKRRDPDAVIEGRALIELIREVKEKKNAEARR